jgi:hypothetical protein
MMSHPKPPPNPGPYGPWTPVYTATFDADYPPRGLGLSVARRLDDSVRQMREMAEQARAEADER